MLGDSFIWGTEHTAPDGKICNFPKKIQIEKIQRFNSYELTREKIWSILLMIGKKLLTS